MTESRAQVGHAAHPGHLTAAAPGPGWYLSRVLIWLVVVVLASLALWQARAFWERLPASQLARLRAETGGGAELPRRFSEALQQAPVRVREAVSLTNLSHRFTTALLVPETLSVGREQIAGNVARHRHSDLGRLHMVAYAMLEREQGGGRIEDGWNILERYLDMVDPQSGVFAHLEADLIQEAADFYRDQGLAAGTAQMEGLRQGSSAHGPFVQYLTARLERLGQSRAAAGDAGGARRCRLIVRRMLREWVLAPASPGLRLMAAELLADILETDPTAGETEQQVGAALREWRGAYRSGVADGRLRLLQLAPGLDSQPAPLLHDALARRLAWLLWLGAAVSVCAVLAVFLLPGWLLRPSSTRACWAGWAAAVVLSAAVWGLFAAVNGPSDRLVVDLRHDFSDSLGWPRGPQVFAALFGALWVLLAGSAALWLRSWKATLRVLGRTAVVTAALAAGWLLIDTFRTERLRQSYEAEVAHALSPAHAIRAVTGEAAEQQLRIVSGWQP